MKMNNSNRRYTSVMLLLLPLIVQYRLVNISPSLLVYAVIFFVYILGSNFLVKISKKSIIYVLYTFFFTGIISIVSGIIPSNTLINKFVGLSLLLLSMYNFLPKMIDFDYTVTIYKYFSIFFSAAVIVQFLMFFVFSHGFVLIIPDIPFGTGDGGNSNEIISAQLLTGRFSSFFLEPAHQAEYCLPALAWTLFPYKEKRDLKTNEYIAAVFISAGIVATTSLLGILGTALLWIYYFGLKMRYGLTAKRIALFLSMVIVGFAFITQPIIQDQFAKKIASLNHLANTNTSLYLRVIVGWVNFSDMPLIYQLFGCGYGNSFEFINRTGIGLQNYASNGLVGYMSGLSRIFFEMGIVGAFVYFYYVFSKIGKNRNLSVNTQIFVIAIIWGTAGVFDTAVGLLPLVLLFSINERRKMSMNN